MHQVPQQHGSAPAATALSCRTAAASSPTTRATCPAGGGCVKCHRNTAPVPTAATVGTATAARSASPRLGRTTRMSQSPPRALFVGVTGASGAPYAVRLRRRRWRPAACRLQLCISDSGVLVLRHELELWRHGARRRHRGLPRRAPARAPRCIAPDDLAAPPASGSSFPDAAVMLPCSMSTAGAHRAGHHAHAHPPRRRRGAQGAAPAGGGAARDAALADPPAPPARAAPRPARVIVPAMPGLLHAARRRCRTPSTTSSARC